jgi:glycosyltransferase involved in cell wall biosynthesis
MVKTIYVLHQNGAPEHYKGLKFLCESTGNTLKFREFTVIRQFAAAVRDRNWIKARKSFVNLLFLVNILFSRDKIIVLGIAPFDYLMVVFAFLARKHQIFFHTSWPYWDKSRFGRRTFTTLFGKVIFRSWKKFLETNCKGIYAVSEYALNNLKKSYNITVRSEVVYHSFDYNNFFPLDNKKFQGDLKCLYVGRLINNKGIPNLLKMINKFKALPISLAIVGWGKLESEVISAAEHNTKLSFLGKIDNRLLGAVYREYDVLILPSKKDSASDWEELFGIALIEGMACGLIPIATSHIGPREIIESSALGYLLSDENLDDQLEQTIKNLLECNEFELQAMRQSVIIGAQKYREAAIALRWKSILDDNGVYNYKNK